MTAFVTALIILMVYLLPGAIAHSKNRSSASAIMMFNILLGWTGICWIAALVWAMSDGKTTA